MTSNFFLFLLQFWFLNLGPSNLRCFFIDQVSDLFCLPEFIFKLISLQLISFHLFYPRFLLFCHLFSLHSPLLSPYLFFILLHEPSVHLTLHSLFLCVFSFLNIPHRLLDETNCLPILPPFIPPFRFLACRQVCHMLQRSIFFVFLELFSLLFFFVSFNFHKSAGLRFKFESFFVTIFLLHNLLFFFLLGFIIKLFLLTMHFYFQFFSLFQKFIFLVLYLFLNRSQLHQQSLQVNQLFIKLETFAFSEGCSIQPEQLIKFQTNQILIEQQVFEAKILHSISKLHLVCELAQLFNFWLDLHFTVVDRGKQVDAHGSI